MELRGVAMDEATAALGASTTVDVVLISIIAALIIGFLVMLIIYGGSVTDQITVLTQRFQTALITAETQFANLMANAVSVFGGLADVAGQAFANFVPQVVATFTAVSSYFTDQLKSIIKQVQNSLFGTASGFTSTILAGMQAVGSAFGTVITQIQNFFFSIQNTLLGLVVQATMFIVTIVNAIINQIVNGISVAIVYAILAVECVVQQITQLVETGLAQIPFIIDQVETFFNGLISAASNTLHTIQEAILEFGEQVSDAFLAVPHFLACILRCVCHFIPLISCPTNCCCDCCDGGNCGNCTFGGCCPCNTFCFFPSNCCFGSCGDLCSCG